jgi:branched-chain amino acid transport system ATP-binding protein
MKWKMLDIQDINTYYGESHILQGLSLQVPEGTVAAILGRNGVGKTTLLHSVNGFVPPRQGSIYYNGVEITKRPVHEIAKQGIALVPQGRRIFSSLNVRENLEVALKKGKDGGQSWDVERIMDFFPRLRERAHHMGNKLSGGEQQMLATGRALAGNPSLLLLDEPTEGLAPIIVKELEGLLLELKKTGVTILLTEQRFGFALRVADHIYVMAQGQIVHDSAPAELWQNEEIKKTYLGV